MCDRLEAYPSSNQFIRINHYWTRTEDHLKKHKLPSKKRRTGHSDRRFRKRIAEFNACTDDTILQFVPSLRERMGLSAESQSSE